MSSRSNATKARLFDAAIELIGEKGFTEVSVDEIVERAGVAKGTVYYHFVGKAELVEALIEDRLQPLAAEFKRAASANADDPAAAIEAIVHAELAFIRDNSSFGKLLITEMWREDRRWRQTLVRIRRDMGATIGAVIEQGIASGSFRTDIDPEFGASALFGMVATVALDWLAFHPERLLEDMQAEITRVTRNALRP